MRLIMCKSIALVFLAIGSVTAQERTIEGASPAGSDETLVLTLDRSIRIALEKSFRIQDVRQDLLRDRANLDAELARLKSNASIYFSLPELSNQLTEQWDSQSESFQFFKTNTTKYQANIRINQPLPTNGNISLNSTLYRRDQVLHSGRPTDYNTNVFIEFRQPIFTPNTLNMGIRRAELGLERSLLRFTGQQLQLIYDVTSTFYNVYRNVWSAQIDSLEVLQRQASYKTAQERYARGDISEMELLQLEVDLAVTRDNLYRSRGDMVRTMAWFKELIGLPLEQPVRIEADLEVVPAEIDMERAITNALQIGPDVRQNEIWKDLRELDLVDAKSRNEFKGMIVASYGLDSAQDDVWSALNSFDKSRGIALQFSVPLWDWGRNQYQAKAAEANLRNAESTLENGKKSIRRNVQNTVLRVQEATGRLEVLKRSEELGQRTYDISLDKFNQGEVSSQDLTLAQNRLTRAKSAYLNAFIAYKIAMADLTRQTMWDFEKGIAFHLN